MTGGATAHAPAAGGSATAETLRSSGSTVSFWMHRNHRLVQQEGGALTRPAALAAEQLLDPGVHQATLIATLVPV